MILTCFVVLLPCFCSSAPTGDKIKISVISSVPVRLGQSITLPCWLDPPRSAEALEVQWYRSDQTDSYIIVHKERKLVYAGQNTPYQGRVTFGTKDAASRGLASGDVSLRLVNVTVKDATGYTCRVSNNGDHDIGVVTLAVSKTGGPAVLSAAWRDDNTVNVSCESGGWYPKPSLQWRDSHGALTEMSLKHSEDSSGLVSVHSWILVSSSSTISCSVGLKGEEPKQGSVYISSSTPPSGQGAAGWVAFALLLIAVLAALGVWWFKNRGNDLRSLVAEIFSCKSQDEEKQDNEAGKDEPLLGVRHSAHYKSDAPGSKTTEDIVDERQAKQRFDKKTMEATDVSKVKDFFVNIKFFRTENQNLSLSPGDCKVRQSENTRGLTNVTCLTALTGSHEFSSGQHYWEVSMKDPGVEGVEAKKSWWLGVTHRAQVPQWADLDPSVSQGFWFLSSSSEGFRFNTPPHELFPVSSRPETVGVYLDCDTGELSFYNVEEKSLIGSLTVADGKRLYPLFNPGLGERSSMTLIHRDKTDFLSAPASGINSSKSSDGADGDNRDNEREPTLTEQNNGEDNTFKQDNNIEKTTLEADKTGDKTSLEEENRKEPTPTQENHGEEATLEPDKNGDKTSLKEEKGEDPTLTQENQGEATTLEPDKKKKKKNLKTFFKKQK